MFCCVSLNDRFSLRGCASSCLICGMKDRTPAHAVASHLMLSAGRSFLAARGATAFRDVWRYRILRHVDVSYSAAKAILFFYFEFMRLLIA